MITIGICSSLLDKVFVLVSGTAPLEKESDLEDLLVTGHAQDPQNHIRVVTMGIGKIYTTQSCMRLCVRSVRACVCVCSPCMHAFVCAVNR